MKERRGRGREGGYILSYELVKGVISEVYELCPRRYTFLHSS